MYNVFNPCKRKYKNSGDKTRVKPSDAARQCVLVHMFFGKDLSVRLLGDVQ